MPARIVLFGSTGYTGNLVATHLVAQGHLPLLVARSRERVAAQAAELGGLEWATADASAPEQLAEVLNPGDILLSTVGPFALHGKTAIDAALKTGAHYIDSTGEPSFVRTLFATYDNPAKAKDLVVLPAFGYDYVPGNLAAALALEAAGPQATRVDVGYFSTGGLRFSGGTMQSAALAMLEDGYALTGGHVAAERFGRRLLRHPVAGRRIPKMSISVAGSEHLGLAATYPNLRDVRVGLGVAGPATPLQWAAMRASAPITSRPAVRRGLRKAAIDRIPGSSGGPSAAFNDRAGILITAHAYDGSGRALNAIELVGPSIYRFTQRMLAWAATTTLADGHRERRAVGVLGPVQAFGLPQLTLACQQAGLIERTHDEKSVGAR